MTGSILRTRGRPSQRRGATFLLFTLVAFPLVMLAAILAVDLSTVYLAKRQVHVGVDAAALAGSTRVLPNSSQLDTADAVRVASETFAQNVAAGVMSHAKIVGSPKITIGLVSGQPTYVKVVVDYQVKATYFVQFFKLSNNITGKVTEIASICNGQAAPTSRDVGDAVVTPCPRPRA